MQGARLSQSPVMSDSLRPAHWSPPGTSSLQFSKQEYWSGQPCLPPGGSSRPRGQTLISHVSCIGRQILYHQHHLRSSPKKIFKKDEMDMKTHFVSDIHFAFWLSFIKQFFSTEFFEHLLWTKFKVLWLSLWIKHWATFLQSLQSGENFTLLFVSTTPSHS